MAIITLNVTDEEKRRITGFSEANNITVSELLLKIIENLEDEEDYKLAEKILNIQKVWKILLKNVGLIVK